MPIRRLGLGIAYGHSSGEISLKQTYVLPALRFAGRRKGRNVGIKLNVEYDINSHKFYSHGVFQRQLMMMKHAMTVRLMRIYIIFYNKLLLILLFVSQFCKLCSEPCVSGLNAMV